MHVDPLHKINEEKSSTGAFVVKEAEQLYEWMDHFDG